MATSYVSFGSPGLAYSIHATFAFTLFTQGALNTFLSFDTTNFTPL